MTLFILILMILLLYNYYTITFLSSILTYKWRIFFSCYKICKAEFTGRQCAKVASYAEPAKIRLNENTLAINLTGYIF